MDWQRLRSAVATVETAPLTGQVVGVIGLVIQSRGPIASVGDICRLRPPNRQGPGLLAEVVGFREDLVLLMPLGDPTGLAPGWEVTPEGGPLPVAVGPSLLGRVLDGLGRPADNKGPVAATAHYPAVAQPPSPLSRKLITQPLGTGVRALDGLLTVGRGQRVGIFAGSGVGKSTLLGMVARGTAADVNVIALIGERGREVREFLERDLGEDGLARSVVVVATSDQPALVRIKGALVATAVAEYFRDQGHDVLLMMDSVTRLALAQREVGLAAGEPPAQRGFTPSVFAMLPRLLERAGTSSEGSITAFYTVLVDGDDTEEPISDAVRGILDGHTVLSRRLAARGQYPAIDLLASVSRVMPSVTGSPQQEAAARFRRLLAIHAEAEDLIAIGAYKAGANPDLDEALERLPEMTAYIRQSAGELNSYQEAVERLGALFRQ